MKKSMSSIASIVAALAMQTIAAAQTDPTPARPQENETKTEYVLMTTSKGDIVIELNREKAPISVANFLSYVDKKFYDGTVFHRIMKNFMIQGGGLTEDGKQKPADKPIKNEWQNGLKNTKGTISMARMGGNADSATSQFFINTVDNAGLDKPQPDGAAYAVFGKVVAGMGTVEKIRNVPVGPDPRGEPSKPQETVKIEKIERMSASDAQKRIDAEKPATGG